MTIDPDSCTGSIKAGHVVMSLNPSRVHFLYPSAINSMRAIAIN